MSELKIRRAYAAPGPDEGRRVLVDRIWPRGIGKADLAGVTWLREVAPSTDLRKWFAHDPARWAEFQRRYTSELNKIPDVRKTILPPKTKGTVTLLFGAKDTEHNNAVALKNYLQHHNHQAS